MEVDEDAFTCVLDSLVYRLEGEVFAVLLGVLKSFHWKFFKLQNCFNK